MTKTTGLVLPTGLTRILLLCGPVLSLVSVMHLVQNGTLFANQQSMVSIVVLMFWTPLFFAFPALLMQDARDKALPELTGLVGSIKRGVLLVPYLALSTKSLVRTEMLLSLVGLGAGIMFVMINA